MIALFVFVFFIIIDILSDLNFGFKFDDLWIALILLIISLSIRFAAVLIERFLARIGL